MKHFVAFLACLALAACSQNSGEVIELKYFPMNSAPELVTAQGGELDRKISSDGQGAVRFEATENSSFRLIEIDDISIENCILTYQARIKADNLKGRAYLEMWCSFDDLGDYYSRDLSTPIIISTDWVTEQTQFILKEGQKPSRVFLHVVVEGSGTVWVDDIHLTTRPV